MTILPEWMTSHSDVRRRWVVSVRLHIDVLGYFGKKHVVDVRTISVYVYAHIGLFFFKFGILFVAVLTRIESPTFWGPNIGPLIFGNFDTILS